MTIDELLAREELRALSGAYMRGLDRLDAALLQSVFHADAMCEYGFFNGSPGDFANMACTALRDHHANHHMLGQINLELDGDVAYGEVYFQAYHRVVVDGQGKDLFVAGRYVDRYERRNGVWKIAYRSEVNDWTRTDAESDAYFRDQPLQLRGARAPDDHLYRIRAVKRP